jgi:hypothetical protein
VLVDWEDYDWLQRWSWACNKQGGWHCPNYYARRTASRNEEAAHGTPFYLHAEVMRRHSVPPSPRHTIVDHCNGNTFDDRRENLRWVTPIENRANRHSFWRTRTPETVWTCPTDSSNTPTLVLTAI